MNREAFERLLAAARALLEAREEQMITRVEWEALAEAVAAASKVQAEGKAVQPASPGGAKSRSRR